MNFLLLAQIAAATFALLMVAVILLWLLSIRVRDVSIIDMAYGLLIGAAALLAFLMADTRGVLQWLMLVLLWLWVIRFSVHIIRRNLGHGEDPRYTRLRAWVGGERAFHWFSLRQVFLHQGLIIWLLSLPAQLVMASSEREPINALLIAGSVLWFCGWIIEAVADYQLNRFRADPDKRGQVLDQGLWRYSRHPNYFGDACVHWGLFLLACSVPWGVLGFVGPLAITHYLLNVTGARTLEKKLLKEKPGYAEYCQRTSAFIPWPPRLNRRD